MSESNPFQQSAADVNPYAAPMSNSVAQEGTNSEFEAIRREHLSHEASIQSVGLLYAIGAVVGVPIFTFAIFGVLAGGGAGPAELAASVGLLALSVGQGFLAYGLRKLRSWARVPAIILSCIGLIGFPIGTLISAYILYLLVSKKGSMVFSSQYQDIIRQTPHIKYRTSKVVWFFLILLLGLIGLGVVLAFVR